MKNVTSLHEFLPTWLMYGPIYADYLKTALRLRTYKYPLIINPMIELSGFVGEKKFEILNRLPKDTYPATALIDPKKSLQQQFNLSTWQKALIVNSETGFPPLICKPDQGERGMGIRFVTTLSELESYHATAPRDYLIQDYVDLPLEFGVFFVRTDEQPAGYISSLCKKEAAVISGDGKRNLRELCWSHPRYQRQVARLEKYIPEKTWNRKLALGEEFNLDVIRNHRRGSCFRDARPLITKKMTEAFQNIFPPESGFNYGRIDLRASDLNSFQDGTGFKILEVNGVTSEPGEIYDPDMSVKESFSILRRHWELVGLIAEEQMAKSKKMPGTLSIYKMFKALRDRKEFQDN